MSVRRFAAYAVTFCAGLIGGMLLNRHFTAAPAPLVADMPAPPTAPPKLPTASPPPAGDAMAAVLNAVRDGRYAAGLDRLEALERSASQATHVEMRRELLTELAAWIEQGRIEQALRLAIEYRRRYVHDAELLGLLATIYERLGRPEDAVVVLFEILDYPPSAQIADATRKRIDVLERNHAAGLAQRREYHALVADHLLADADDEVAARIAHHLECSGRDQETLDWRRRAAKHARETFALTEAAAHLEQARRTSDSPELLVELGDLYQETGELTTATERYQQLLDVGDQRALPSARLQALLGLAREHMAKVMACTQPPMPLSMLSKLAQHDLNDLEACEQEGRLDPVVTTQCILTAGFRPQEEPYLHSKIAHIVTAQLKKLREGSYPIRDSAFAYGVPDPTGTLEVRTPAQRPDRHPTAAAVATAVARTTRWARKAHPVATNAASGDASLTPLPQAGGAGGEQAPKDAVPLL